MVQHLTYDAFSPAFPAGEERERVMTDLNLHPDWRIAATGSWKIVGCPAFIGSIVDCTPERRHVDHLRWDDVILIQFGLNGTVEFRFENGQHYHQTGLRLSFCSLARGTRLERVIPSNQRVRYVGISLRIADFVALGCDPVFLHDDLHALVEPGSSRPFIVNFSLSPQQFAAADALLTNQYTGRLRQNFVNAKLCELVCLAIDQLMWTRHGRHRHSARSARDRDNQALEVAVGLLSKESGACVAVADLPNRVGLNRNKLSAGFRERFGETPASFARKARLEHARTLLKNSRLSIHEVAWQVGFTSQSSFTRAYRLEFGAPPGRHRIAGDRCTVSKDARVG